MAVYPITKQQLLDASNDAGTLEKVVNGPVGVVNPGHPDGTVTSRLGRVYDNLATAIAKIAQSGGTIGKQTLEQLENDLNWPENTVAFVSNDPDPKNLGFYIKKGAKGEGEWLQSPYEAVASTIAAVISALGIYPEYPQDLAVDTDGFAHAYAVLDHDGQIGLGILEEGGASIASAIFFPSIIENELAPAFSIVDSSYWAALHVNGRGDTGLGNMMFRTVDSLSPQHFAWAVADDDGQVALAVTTGGHAQLASMAVTEVPSEQYVWALADSEGSIALAVTKDGAVIIGDTPPVPGPEEKRLQSLANQRTDYMHIFIYGQSLSRGTTASPVISTTQPYANVTFRSGVLKRSMDTGVDYSDFKPLVEESLETPTSGACNMMSELIATGGDSSTWQFVGTAPGNGGTSIENLSKGTVYWNSMMDQVSAGVSVAASHDQTYSVWAMLWAQGENNYSTNDSVSQYLDKLVGMKNDFAFDVAARTRQGFVPPLITYQVAAHRRYGKNHNNVAIAQWYASLRDKDIVMACPIYHLPHSTDNLHLTNDSSQQMGKYLTTALYQTMVQGRRFKPLQPEQVIWQGRLIDLTFNVPVGSLQFDTSQVAAAPNYGFDVWNGEANDNSAIATVELAAGNRIRIKMAREPQIGDFLTYARGRIGDPGTSGPTTGPRGNLRDQAGETDNYIDSTGSPRYMHNWCIMFQYVYGEEDNI